MDGPEPIATVRRLCSGRAAAALALWLAAALPAVAVTKPDRPCESLSRAALGAARQMLQLHGEFAPYGVGFTASREMVEVDAAQDAAAGRTPVEALRQALAQALESQPWQATALVYEATLNTPPDARTDAIVVAVEQRGGCSALVVYPYRFTDGQVVVEPAQVLEQQRRAAAPPSRARR